MFGEHHSAHHVLDLCEGRFGFAKVAEGVAPLRLELAPDAADNLDVLGMGDDDDAVVLRRALKQVEEEAVVGAVEAEVATFLALEVHEVFERHDTPTR